MLSANHLCGGFPSRDGNGDVVVQHSQAKTMTGTHWEANLAAPKDFRRRQSLIVL